MRVFRVLFVFLAASLAVPGRAEIAPGTVLDKSTASQAEKLLPPEILKHYQNDEYVNPVVPWTDTTFVWPKDFVDASKSNAGKYVVAPEGHIVEKASGQQPPYIFGFPFPTIDPAEPSAGSQVLWNHLYRTWYFGNNKAESQINMIGRTSLERRLDVVSSFAFYDGVPPAERMQNDGNFLSKFLSDVRNPVDVNGTLALTWRYRDAGKRDSTWAFVPALRRVRAVSPANRSDGFLGSDFAQDDGNFFEGKPEDFTWKLVGESDQLRLVDPIGMEGKSKHRWVAPRGWDVEWPDIPFIGYMDPAWKGVAWAPRTGALAQRKFYVVEAVPKDRYYLFGKMQLYIDKETFQGAWNRKFDWKGELLNVYQVMAFNVAKVTRPDGSTDYVQASNMAFQTNEAVKNGRATAAGIKSRPDAMFLLRGEYEPGFFDLDRLSQSGK